MNATTDAKKEVGRKCSFPQNNRSFDRRRERWDTTHKKKLKYRGRKYKKAHTERLTPEEVISNRNINIVTVKKKKRKKGRERKKHKKRGAHKVSRHKPQNPGRDPVRRAISQLWWEQSNWGRG